MNRKFHPAVLLTYVRVFARLLFTTLSYWLVVTLPEENHWRKGDAWVRIGAYRWAAWHFRKFLKYNNDPRVKAHLGWCYAQMGMLDSAVEHYREAYARNKHPSIALCLAYAEAGVGNRDAAQAIVQQLITHRHELSAEEVAELNAVEKSLASVERIN